MSRSYKKPYCGMTCGESEKWDKQKANRKMRRLLREYIMDENTPSRPKKQEFSERATFRKWYVYYCPESISSYRK